MGYGVWVGGSTTVCYHLPPSLTPVIRSQLINHSPVSAPTQNFFNTTLKYLDRLDYVTHYSWFGSFRSDVSNVGPNGAMLNKDGEITDIGAWYLGRQGKGIKPNTGNSAARIRRGDWVLWGIVYFIISLRAL